MDKTQDIECRLAGFSYGRRDMNYRYDVGDEVLVKGTITKIVQYKKDEKPLYSINHSDTRKEGFLP